MELLSPGHLVPLLILAAILFFGWKQLPDMAKSAGRSLRIFKSEMKGMAEDDRAREAAKQVQATSTTETGTTQTNTVVNGEVVDTTQTPVDPTANPHTSDK